MKVFTYNQYIKFIHRVRLNAVLQIAEEKSKYMLEKNGMTKDKRKLETPIEPENNKETIKKNVCLKNEIREILNNNEEVANLINTFLKPKRIIKGEDLYLYKSNYIDKKYSSEEWTIIYKRKNMPVFYLLKNQMYVDNEINYKMLNICVDIIQSWSRNRKLAEDIREPIIVPIIIYTGEEKLKIVKTTNQSNYGSNILEKNQIDIGCNIIDINKIDNDLLIRKNTLFCDAILKQRNEY